MTRWRVVRAPDGKYAVLSDRPRGPVVGARDGLYGWEIIPGARWQTFEEACLEAATHNGKPSTANMGPQHAAAEYRSVSRDSAGGIVARQFCFVCGCQSDDMRAGQFGAASHIALAYVPVCGRCADELAQGPQHAAERGG